MKILVTVALAAALVAAEDKPEAAIIPVKALSGDAFERLVKLIGVFQIRFTADSKLRTIVAYGPKDTIAEMRRVIEELDKPGSGAAIGRNIDLSVWFLKAMPNAPTEPSALPPELEPVAKQLRAATAYKHIQLWETAPMRIQEGKKAEQTSRLPSAVPQAVASVQISMFPESVYRKDGATYVRFDSLRFNFRIPFVTSPGVGVVSTQYQFFDAGINTSGDFKEGQKSVLGKVSGIDEAGAIFVVITPKVLD